ncbi:Hypothetical protein NTJ_11651 [Nesidiocoris tenuis]|nr:Hypothetical protein NTJ_11651 [Nesidiocoris tenuis]
MGNTLDIISENETVLNMKMRVGEAKFHYPNCRIYSKSNLFNEINMPLDGSLLSSDFDISVVLKHQPTCNATLQNVKMIDMNNMSLKFLESKMPKLVADGLASLFARFNKKLLNGCVTKAVEESVTRLTEKIDMCVIFHPNLRANDEL